MRVRHDDAQGIRLDQPDKVEPSNNSYVASMRDMK
jgi:hypothetical protein